MRHSRELSIGAHARGWSNAAQHAAAVAAMAGAARPPYRCAVFELTQTRIDINVPMTPAFSENTVAVPGMPRWSSAGS